MLYSGGFDSYLISFLTKPDILLYFDIKGAYSKQELAAINSHAVYGKKFIVDHTLNLGLVEDKKTLIVPNRNLLFITRALDYGNHILVGFTEGDTAPDKTSLFINRTRLLLNGLSDSPVYLQAPYKKCTKASLLRLCLKKGLSPVEAQHIRSCYLTSKKGCGTCYPCFTKAVALYHNDLFDPRLFDKDPREYKKIYLRVAEKYRSDTRTFKDIVSFVNKA